MYTYTTAEKLNIFVCCGKPVKLLTFHCDTFSIHFQHAHIDVVRLWIWNDKGFTSIAASISGVQGAELYGGYIHRIKI